MVAFRKHEPERPREPRKCCRCGCVSELWRWEGNGIVSCLVCLSKYEEQDEREVARMKAMATVVSVARSRVVEIKDWER